VPPHDRQEICRRKGRDRGQADEAAEQPEKEYTEERFAQLARFLFARTDLLLLNRPDAPDTDRAVQALNNAVRALLGQARAYREWATRLPSPACGTPSPPSPSNGDTTKTS
jgi:hypothetical protein